MSNKPVLYIRDPRNKNELRVVIESIPDWEGFDKLIQYLKDNYNATVLELYNGPDARRGIILVKGVKIELIFSDHYGNYFLAPTMEGEVIIQEIGKDLEERLKDIEE